MARRRDRAHGVARRRIELPDPVVLPVGGQEVGPVELEHPGRRALHRHVVHDGPVAGIEDHDVRRRVRILAAGDLHGHGDRVTRRVAVLDRKLAAPAGVPRAVGLPVPAALERAASQRASARVAGEVRDDRPGGRRDIQFRLQLEVGRRGRVLRAPDERHERRDGEHESDGRQTTHGDSPPLPARETTGQPAGNVPHAGAGHNGRAPVTDEGRPAPTAGAPSESLGRRRRPRYFREHHLDLADAPVDGQPREVHAGRQRPLPAPSRPSQTAECEPASIDWSTSVATSLPARSYTESLTLGALDERERERGHGVERVRAVLLERDPRRDAPVVPERPSPPRPAARRRRGRRDRVHAVDDREARPRLFDGAESPPERAVRLGVPADGAHERELRVRRDLPRPQTVQHVPRDRHLAPAVHAVGVERVEVRDDGVPERRRGRGAVDGEEAVGVERALVLVAPVLEVGPEPRGRERRRRAPTRRSA